MEKQKYAVKVLKETENEIIVGGYGIIFGGEDLDGETFSPNTELMLDLVPEKPVFYSHSLDAIETAIGKVIKEAKDEIGVWLEAQLDKSSRYIDAILQLIEEGRLGWSSGSVGHLVRLQGKFISRWPVIEYSLTPTPAEPRTLGVEQIKSIGLETNTERKVLEMVNANVMKETEQIKNKQKVRSLVMEEKDKLTQEGQETIKQDVKETDDILSELKQTAEEYRKEVEQLKEQIKQAKIEIAGDSVVSQKNVNINPKFGHGDPDPSEDFANWVKTGVGKIKAHKTVRTFKFPNGYEYKAELVEGIDAQGGYLVPDEVYTQIIAKRDQNSLMSQLGLPAYTTDRDVFKFPVEDTAMGLFAIIGEGQDKTPAQDEPTFAEKPVMLYKFNKLIKLSEEIYEDYNTNLLQFLTNSIGDKWGNTETYYLLVGGGTTAGEPEGVIVGGKVPFLFNSATDITPQELVKLMGSLKSGYRQGAVFVMHRTTHAHLMAKTGEPFQLLTPAVGTFASNLPMLGYPVLMTEYLDELAASKITVVFGNFNYYGWVRNRSLRVERLMELFKMTGHIGILATFRAGGMVLQEDAFMLGQQGTVLRKSKTESK